MYNIEYKEAKRIVETMKVISTNSNNVLLTFGTKDAGENVNCMFTIVRNGAEQVESKFIASKPKNWNGEKESVVLKSDTFINYMIALLSLTETISLDIGTTLKLSVKGKVELTMPILADEEMDALLPSYKEIGLAQLVFPKADDFRAAVKKGTYAASDSEKCNCVILRIQFEDGTLKMYSTDTATIAGSKINIPIFAPNIIEGQMQESIDQNPEKEEEIRKGFEKQIEMAKQMEEARIKYCEERQTSPDDFRFAIPLIAFRNMVRLLEGVDTFNMKVGASQVFISAPSIIYTATLTQTALALPKLIDSINKQEPNLVIQMDVEDFSKNIQILNNVSGDKNIVPVTLVKKGENIIVSSAETVTHCKCIACTGDEECDLFFNAVKLKNILASLEKGNMLLELTIGDKPFPIRVVNGSLKDNLRDKGFSYLLPANKN